MNHGWLSSWSIEDCRYHENRTWSLCGLVPVHPGLNMSKWTSFLEISLVTSYEQEYKIDFWSPILNRYRRSCCGGSCCYSRICGCRFALIMYWRVRNSESKAFQVQETSKSSLTRWQAILTLYWQGHPCSQFFPQGQLSTANSYCWTHLR